MLCFGRISYCIFCLNQLESLLWESLTHCTGGKGGRPRGSYVWGVFGLPASFIEYSLHLTFQLTSHLTFYLKVFHVILFQLMVLQISISYILFFTPTALQILIPDINFNLSNMFNFYCCPPPFEICL